MFAVQSDTKRSKIGLTCLVGSIATVVVPSVVDAVLKASATDFTSSARYIFLGTLVVDFRYIFEQFVYAATIFFVGAKFLESRTILSVGFDKIDRDKMAVRGPDENNMVWVGRRYATALEAEAVSAAMSERIGPSSAKKTSA